MCCCLHAFHHYFTLPSPLQFWTIKSQNYDVVLFFKKGKFYELYAPGHAHTWSNSNVSPIVAKVMTKF